MMNFVNGQRFPPPAVSQFLVLGKLLTYKILKSTFLVTVFLADRTFHWFPSNGPVYWQFAMLLAVLSSAGRLFRVAEGGRSRVGGQGARGALR